MASSSASRPRRSGRGPSSRSKREEILATATEYFGKQGYEYTKWADVAEAVGVGSTALYHYFESKLHCLYEIQAGALAADREKFDRVITEHEDFAEALKAVLDATFDLTENEVLRNRVLVAEQSLVGLHRTSAREEEARELARSRMRDTEFAWATFLTGGWSRARSRNPTRGCSPARFSASTPASGTGTDRAADSSSLRSATSSSRAASWSPACPRRPLRLPRASPRSASLRSGSRPRAGRPLKRVARPPGQPAVRLSPATAPGRAARRHA